MQAMYVESRTLKRGKLTQKKAAHVPGVRLNFIEARYVPHNRSVREESSSETLT